MDSKFFSPQSSFSLDTTVNGFPPEFYKKESSDLPKKSKK